MTGAEETEYIEKLVDLEEHFLNGLDLAKFLAKKLDLGIAEEHLLEDLQRIQTKLEDELHFRYSIRYRRKD